VYDMDIEQKDFAHIVLYAGLLVYFIYCEGSMRWS